MPRPRSGDWLRDEITDWGRLGINKVVSLLEAHEVTDLSLAEEPALCAALGISYISFPIRDRDVPSSIPAINALVEPLVTDLVAGLSVAVHCRAGIGRSALVAGCILLRAGIPYARVFPALARARGLAVPDTTEQEEWVQAFSRFGS